MIDLSKIIGTMNRSPLFFPPYYLLELLEEKLNFCLATIIASIMSPDATDTTAKITYIER
jgi:hypothetical protein